MPRIKLTKTAIDSLPTAKSDVVYEYTGLRGSRGSSYGDASAPRDQPQETGAEEAGAKGEALISIAKQFARLVCWLGIVSATLFALVAVKIYSGEHLLLTLAPLSFYAYPLLKMNFFGLDLDAITREDLAAPRT